METKIYLCFLNPDIYLNSESLMSSFTEENYLKAIFKLSGKENKPISTNGIAEQTKTKAATVTDMLKRLADKKLIHYKKYKGVTLTAEGKKIAVSIIRKHRLWEVLLVEKLKFRWDEVHDIAEQLEHVQSDKLVERMDTFLGHPRFDPHGDPIPDVHGKFHAKKTTSLSEIKPGTTCIMTGVADHSASFLRYLDKNGIALGNEIKIKEITEYDKSVSILIQKNKAVYLSNDVARNILVSLL